MSNNKRKPVRVLTDLKISEISAVDKGAGEGCRVMLRKRQRPEYESVFHQIFGVKKKQARSFGYAVPPVTAAALWREAEALRKNDEFITPPADDDEGFDNPDTDADADDDDDNGSTPHFLGGTPENPEETEPTDQLESAERAMKEKNMKPHSMSDVVKKHGIVAFCRSVEKGNVHVSEHELTKLISDQAEREGSTFSKLFCAQNEQGIALRKAIDAANNAQWLEKTSTMSKAATLEPRFVGGADARAVNNPKSALAQLKALVDQQRATNPTLSEAGAFAAVYTDPKNADLAARERAENRPVATW
jgi:hypothetical protein